MSTYRLPIGDLLVPIQIGDPSLFSLYFPLTNRYTFHKIFTTSFSTGACVVQDEMDVCNTLDPDATVIMRKALNSFNIVDWSLFA
jgi:hypothetical protein